MVAPLAVGSTEVIATQHLAVAGRLSPTQLGARLRLSSGATSAATQRLQKAGYVRREANPGDGRSVLLRLSPEIQTHLGDVMAPLVEHIEALVAGLAGVEAGVALRFLEGVVALIERHDEQLRRPADVNREVDPPLAVPSLWA